jgi:hypothetical protein
MGNIPARKAFCRFSPQIKMPLIHWIKNKWRWVNYCQRSSASANLPQCEQMQKFNVQKIEELLSFGLEWKCSALIERHGIGVGVHR